MSDQSADSLKQAFSELDNERANLEADPSQANARAYFAVYNYLADRLGEHRMSPEEKHAYRVALRIIPQR